jgi:hypothetical protein
LIELYVEKKDGKRERGRKNSTPTVLFFSYSFFEIMRKEPIDCNERKVRSFDYEQLLVALSENKEKKTNALFGEREFEFNLFAHL